MFSKIGWNLLAAIVYIEHVVRGRKDRVDPFIQKGWGEYVSMVEASVYYHADVAISKNDSDGGKAWIEYFKEVAKMK